MELNAPPILWIALGVGVLLLALGLGLWLKRRKRQAPPLVKPLTVGLEKTRANLLGRLNGILGHQPAINDALLAELEEILIGADMGVNTTQKLLSGMKEDVLVGGHSEIYMLKEYLGEEIYKILRAPTEDYEPPQTPHVMMIVGVNGVGKTTTIGKLAHRYKEEGNKILLAAADTFRAGAVNQLKAWGDRVEATTLAPQEGSDPAAVAFDAVKAGVARGMDRVIIDTAGRLHTKVNLMEELKKVKRVIAKALPGAPHEVWLIIDATQGQNALQQARQFHEALKLTGIVLTKLDSTAKGGIAVGIADELKVPIVYVGIGEKLEDLQPFESRDFVDALLA